MFESFKTADPLATDFSERLSRKYGDYVLHAINCADEDVALAFVCQLPFISGGPQFEDLIAPSNTEILVSDADIGGVAVVIGGQLTEDENYAVRSLAWEMGLEIKALCVAHGGTLVMRGFIRAARRYKALLERTKPAAKTPWWKLWGGGSRRAER